MSSQPKANGSRLGRKMRLTRAGQFQLVFGANVRTAVGPLLVWALPNQLGHPRLGFAISRRVGTAVARNRIKRRLREAFRLMQHDLSSGYDFVVSVRRHEPLTLAEYQKALFKAVRAVDLTWSKRLRRPNDSGPAAAGGNPREPRTPVRG